METIRRITAAGLLLCALSAQAQRGDYTDGNLMYSFTSDSTVAFMGTTQTTAQELTVPAAVTYKGHVLTVTSLGSEAFSRTAVRHVALPATLTSIDERAFQDCNRLQHLSLPDGITSIGMYAFSGCDSVVIDHWPEQLASIDVCAFNRCNSLTEVVLPACVRKVDHGFGWCAELERLVFTGFFESGNRLVYNCPKLKQVVFEQGADAIGSFAFGDCTALEEVVFQGRVRFIGANAFEGCTSLKRITMPEGLATLDNQMFYGCTALEQVVFQAGLEYLSTNAFTGCTALREVVLPSTLQVIGDAFVGCTALEDITIPHAVTRIGWHAFEGCTGLKRLTCLAKIPPTLDDTALPEDAYERLEVTVPAGCEETYRASAGWKEFAHLQKQEFIDYTCFAKVHMDYYEYESFKGTIRVNGQPFRQYEGYVEYQDGSELTIAVEPDAGYTVAQLTVNGRDCRYLLDDGLLTLTAHGDTKIEVQFTDAPATVTLQQVDEGEVRLNALCNHAYRYYVRATEEWHIHSISFNGEDVTDRVRYDGLLKTPQLTGDAVINVTFEQPTAVGAEAVSRLKVLVQGCRVQVTGADEGEVLTVCDLSGRQVCVVTARQGAASFMLPAGQVYVLRTTHKIVKFRL